MDFQKLIKNFDDWAEIDEREKSAAIVWLDRAVFLFLLLTMIFAPHSIAATQSAWLIGLLCAGVRWFAFSPKPFKLERTPLDVPFIALFLWTLLTAIFSFAPDLSLDKMKSAAMFILFYFVFFNTPTARKAKLFAFVLLGSCLINVAWMPIERVIGRGVQVYGIENTPFSAANLKDGDTFLEINGKKIRTPEQIAQIARADNAPTFSVKFYRPDYYATFDVEKKNFASDVWQSENLGLSNWKRGRNWRSAGFYGHYTTYAEVLQLLTSLALGLFISSLQNKSADASANRTRHKMQIFLLICLIGMSFALLLTTTRASQGGLLISAFCIVALGASRRFFLTAAAIALPVAGVALYFLQRARNVGFFDKKDDSTLWRATVYREGFELWTNNARNFLLGVGMESVKRFKGDWHLFDNGKLPSGHFHSTFLQLAIERGLPALFIWFYFIYAHLKTLFDGVRDKNLPLDWTERGIILGAFGGAIGFFTAGIVHYNAGDSEVMMMFFIIAALAHRLIKTANRDLRAAAQ